MKRKIICVFVLVFVFLCGSVIFEGCAGKKDESSEVSKTTEEKIDIENRDSISSDEEGIHESAFRKALILGISAAPFIKDTILEKEYSFVTKKQEYYPDINTALDVGYKCSMYPQVGGGQFYKCVSNASENWWIQVVHQQGEVFEVSTQFDSQTASALYIVDISNDAVERQYDHLSEQLEDFIRVPSR